MESRIVLSGLTLAPAPHPPGASAAEVKQAVATPLAQDYTVNTVRIANYSRLWIEVTATLLVPSSIDRPTKETRIPPGIAEPRNKETISFGNVHTAYQIHISVRPSPDLPFMDPLDTTLPMPPAGYHGKLFEIDSEGGRFHLDARHIRRGYDR
jgi:hypothetical protein